MKQFIIMSLISILLASFFHSNKLQAQDLIKYHIAESADLISPLLNGQILPSIMVTKIDGSTEQLATFLNGQKTILFFYRGGWCPFCNTQMGQLQKIAGRLEALGFNLVGISTDAPEGLQKSVEQRDLSYALLSDYNSAVSSAFGISFFTSAKTTKRYLAKMDLKNPLQKKPN